MSVFGSLGYKIAHASTIPSLGNQDLRALQDLITREKEVVASIQRLSSEITRANEALKAWGQGEGLDLGDTLAQSTGALSHVVSALNGFAAHEQNIRAHMKEIRTREENLDDLQKRRKNVAVKAEAAEKKLNKMGSENKYLAQQTNLLAQLTEEMRQLDTEILSEEARVGDFKRRVTKQFMLLKFGGLLEFAEKATIVGELGKLIINEIPLETTAPGQPRVPYNGYEKTVQLSSEITRCINEVRFVADPDHSALAALKGNSKDDASELSELVPPPPLTAVLEPEFGRRTPDIAKPPSPSSPKKATFGGVLSSLGRSASPEHPRDPPLSLPVGNREPYQANSQRAAYTDPPNLFLPEIGGPSLSASLGFTSPPNEGEQSIEGLPVSSTSNIPVNNNESLDRMFMNIPSEFGGRPPFVTENRTVSSSTPPALPAPITKPQYNTLPLSRPSEEKAVMPLVTGTPPPPALAPTLVAKPPAPSTPVQQSAPQGSLARIMDPPGTKVAAGRFAAFPLKSRRVAIPQPAESNLTTNTPSQSRPVVVIPTTTDTPDIWTAKAGAMPPKSESPRPSMDGDVHPPTSENTKPRTRRNDSARVRFAATPPITPATGTFTKDSDDAPDDDFNVPQMDDGATEELIDEPGGQLGSRGRPVSVAAGFQSLGDTKKHSNGLNVAPLQKKLSSEPPAAPEPVMEVEDMSEAELNAMIDAMAAQVGHATSPSSTFSPANQFSPISGSPSSTLATPLGSRVVSATYATRTLASSSPAGGDSPISASGRISAAAFKRPTSKMPVLPSNPRFTEGDATSKSSMAPGLQSRVLETRRSTEEDRQAFSQRAATPPTQNIRANQTPSPPPVTAPVQPAEHHLSHEISPTPLIPMPPEITANAHESSRLPPATTSVHYSRTPPPPSPPPPFPLPVPPAPQTPEMDFEIIPTPEYEKDEVSLNPRFKSLDTSSLSLPTSLQTIDSLGTHGSPEPQGDNPVAMPLPTGAGFPRRPDSLLPGGRRDSPVPSLSPERGHSRPGSGSFNTVPLSLRPGTPRSVSPAEQDFTGVGSSPHPNKDGSPRPGNSPPSAGPPSLMPLSLHSPILDFGDFGSTKGYGAAGQLHKAPSHAGYGEGKFMTNLEDEYKQTDPKRGSGSWR